MNFKLSYIRVFWKKRSFFSFSIAQWTKWILAFTCTIDCCQIGYLLEYIFIHPENWRMSRHRLEWFNQTYLSIILILRYYLFRYVLNWYMQGLFEQLIQVMYIQLFTMHFLSCRQKSCSFKYKFIRKKTKAIRSSISQIMTSFVSLFRLCWALQVIDHWHFHSHNTRQLLDDPMYQFVWRLLHIDLYL